MTRGIRIKLMAGAVVLLSGLNAMAQHILEATYIEQTTTTSTAIPAGAIVAIGNPITVTPAFRTGCTIVADMWLPTVLEAHPQINSKSACWCMG